MTESEALALLTACKPLADRLNVGMDTKGTPLKYNLSRDDLALLQAFDRLQTDPLTAGPGLFSRLTRTAGLNQGEVSKLEQVSRRVARNMRS